MALSATTDQKEALKSIPHLLSEEEIDFLIQRLSHERSPRKYTNSEVQTSTLHDPVANKTQSSVFQACGKSFPKGSISIK